MKIILVTLFSMTTIFANGGDLGGGGSPGINPVKDERVRDINAGKVQVIDLNARFGSYLQGSTFSSGGGTVGSGGNANGGGVKPLRLDKAVLKIEQIEEVTLKDGTVVSQEEILEAMKNALKN